MGLTKTMFIVVATYVFSGWVGLEFLAVPPGYSTPIFFPAGIAVSAIFLSGPLVAPAVFVGSFLLNGLIGYHVGGGHVSVGSVQAAALVALWSTVQALVGAAIFSRVLGFYAITLISRQNLWRLSILAPVVCLTSSSLSILSLWYLGIVATAQALDNWTHWWTGDTFGVLLAVPWMLFFLPTDRQMEYALRQKIKSTPPG